MGRVETKKSQQKMFKKRREDKSKYNTLFYQFGGEKNRRKFKKKDGTWYEVRKDGTLSSRPPVATILGALNDGPRHPYIDASNKPNQKYGKSVLAILKSIKPKKKSNNIKKSINIKKGAAQASTLDDKKKEDKKPIVVKKKEEKKPIVVKKKEKKNNFGVDTFDKSKVIKTRDIKTIKTKKADMSNIIKKNGKKTVKPKSRLDAKGNYKGTNIKPTKLQLERLKRRGLA